MSRQPCIYILTNQRNGTLYVGVTSNLVQRIYLHRQGCTEDIARRYACRRLVYFEPFDSLVAAHRREKQLRNWKRASKLKLIQDANPEWRDLWGEITA